jgi:hypothetical protein
VLPVIGFDWSVSSSNTTDVRLTGSLVNLIETCIVSINLSPGTDAQAARLPPASTCRDIITNILNTCLYQKEYAGLPGWTAPRTVMGNTGRCHHVQGEKKPGAVPGHIAG